MENSIWGPIQGIAGIGCLLFAILNWAGITPSSFKARRGFTVPLNTTKNPILIGVLLTLSLALFSGSTFTGVRATYPRLAWWTIVGFCVLDLFFWIILSSGSKQAVPENPSLKEQLEACRRESKLNENQFNTELSRAREFYRQCEEEKRNALKKLEEVRMPRIYPTLKEPGEVSDHPMQTRLVLENGGETEAHNVEVKEIQLRIGKVTFTDHPIGVIHPTQKEEITPRCDAFGPAFSMNIIYALRKEFGTYTDQLTRETISIPMIVTYLDFQDQKFETTCDLVFHAIRDALKPNFGNDKPSVEFQNFHFGKVSV